MGQVKAIHFINYIGINYLVINHSLEYFMTGSGKTNQNAKSIHLVFIFKDKITALEFQLDFAMVIPATIIAMPTS